ncbi:type II secretion system protein N [Enterovirga sp. GCM10030262]|uniref:type II secretion system protein N n=1 Tax=Enterovirga sp. GCM10030262 TaxID=3273391 RepID=UPI00361514B7
MRLALDPRARRLLRRVPRNTVYTALELILLSLLALQGARLAWTLVTPVDPVGDWRAPGAVRAPLPGSAALLGQFDPFFRLSGDAGPVVVTSLDLILFGVREDRATGGGSAIIGTPDGQQRSFAVGEEIVPGVTLTAVTFDGVTISRGGTAEQLFLDQSPPATMVGPEASAPVVTQPSFSVPAPVPAQPASSGSIASDVQFQPRMDGAEVTGVTVQPQGSGEAFRAAGLAPGDVIVSVNGRRIRSADQARGLAGQLGGAREIVVQVERDGRVVPLRVRPGQ